MSVGQRWQKDLDGESGIGPIALTESNKLFDIWLNWSVMGYSSQIWSSNTITMHIFHLSLLDPHLIKWNLIKSWCLPDCGWLNAPELANEVWVDQGEMRNTQRCDPQGPGLRSLGHPQTKAEAITEEPQTFQRIFGAPCRRLTSCPPSNKNSSP